MAYPTSTRQGKQFLGNKNKKEVHDLKREDKNQNGCQVDEFLKAGHGVAFTPDTLQQAHFEGYDNCAKCIGNSKR
ncbi:MAG: hypothetical protein H7A34_01800 [bacterium]|nr:hypothetical protein [bacterium]